MPNVFTVKFGPTIETLSSLKTLVECEEACLDNPTCERYTFYDPDTEENIRCALYDSYDITYPLTDSVTGILRLLPN